MSYKFIRKIFIILSILSAIIFIIFMKEANSDYAQCKTEKKDLVKVKGSINSYTIDDMNNRYYLGIKLKDYDSEFQFSADSWSTIVDWSQLEADIQDLKECEIWILKNDKDNIQKSKNIDIQQLQIEGKKYIEWTKVVKKYYVSFYLNILLLAFSLFTCLFFAYLASGKRYLKIN